MTIVVLVGIFIVLPLLILWVRDKVFNRPPSPEEARAFSERFRKRLSSPDLSAVAEHFGCTVPAALRELYGNLAVDPRLLDVKKRLRFNMDEWMIREGDYLPLPTHVLPKIK